MSTVDSILEKATLPEAGAGWSTRMSTALATVRMSAEEEATGLTLEKQLQKSVLLVTSKLNNEAKTTGHRIIGVYAPSFAFNIASNGDTIVVVALCALFLQPEENHATKIANPPARVSPVANAVVVQPAETEEAAIKKIIGRSTQRFEVAKAVPVPVAPADIGITRKTHQISVGPKATGQAEAAASVLVGGEGVAGAYGVAGSADPLPAVPGNAGKSPSMRGVF